MTNTINIIRARKCNRKLDSLDLRTFVLSELDNADSDSKPFLIYDEFQPKIRINKDNEESTSDVEVQDDTEWNDGIYSEDKDPKNRILIFATINFLIFDSLFEVLI
jgi:hypothetical protein